MKEFTDHQPNDMKKLLLLTATVFLFSNAFSQNVSVQIDGTNLYYNESGCDDCNGDADPRWRMRARVNGTAYDWNRDRDGFCGWTGYTNSNWVPYTTVPSTASIQMQMNGYESDGFICGGDDAQCGGYSTRRTIGDVDDYPPCQWNYFTDYRTCSEGTYGVQWGYYWYYQTINSGSINGTQTVCYNGNPSTLGNASSGSVWVDYQWQSSLTGVGSWNNISGATGSTYNPPGGLTQTTYYRRRASTCGPSAPDVFTNIVTVTVLPEFVVGSISGGGGTFCSPADPAAMSVSPTGGTGSYSYQWYYVNGTSCPSSGGAVSIPGATSATYNPPAGLTQTRSYQVQVNPTGSPDCGGATWTNNCVTVNVNPQPAGTISNSGVICEGDAATLTFNFTAGTGPYDVQYSGGGTTVSLNNINDGHTETVSPSTTTTYSITQITDDNSCVNTSVGASTTLTVNPMPNGDMAVTPTVCQGETATITFSFNSGTGPFDIEFTDGVTNTSLSGVNDGDTHDVIPPTTVTYTYVTITDDNGCTRTSAFTGSAQVVVNPIPVVSFTGLASDYCEIEGAVTLTGNQAPSGSFSGPGITDLSNGTASFAPSSAGVGTHTITYSYTDINSCSNDAGQIVNIEEQPTANAGSGGNQCDLNFDLAAVPSVASGEWSQTAGPGFVQFLPSASDPNATVTVSQYGSYEFTWSEGIYCSDSDGITVNFYEQPVADAGTGGNECDLDFEFSASPSVVGSNGSWSQISGPGTSSYTDATDPAATVTVSLIGQYEFQWEETNGTCSDSETITVNFFNQPVANAGFGGSECDLDFQLGAVSSVGVGSWSASGPGTVNFTPDATAANAIADVSSYGVYIFTWTEDNFGCTDDASITVNFDQQASADAGDGGEECDLTFTFNAAPAVGTGTWTYAGPGNAFFSSLNDPLANVTVDEYGAYLFTWTDVNGSCTAVDFVNVTFWEQPVADAGAGGDECDLNFDFSAVLSSGLGEWSQLNGPGTSTFGVSSDPTTQVTVTEYGTYTFRWTETNGICSDNETVVVNFYEQPVADAGTGGDACNLNYSFNGSNLFGVGLWTASGPGTATFSSDISPTSDVSVSSYGTYEFTWTVINGTCSDAETIMVNFYEQPVADAGLGGDVCGLDFTFNAIDGVGDGVWSQTSGSGNSTFSGATSASSGVSVDAYGTYDFTWTETNGSCSDFATVSVNFYELPIADAGIGGDECDLDFTLSANASVPNGEWAYTGPGTATFGSSTAATTTVDVSQSGTYTFTWTETNGICVDSDDVVVNFYDQPVADAGTGGDECDFTFDLNAVPTFGNGTWSATGPGNASFTSVNSETGQVTVDAEGTYVFTWSVVNGICTDDASISVDFYVQPVANAGAGGSECDLDFELNGTASVGTGTWTYTGPGTASFSPSANDPAATVTVDATGSYVFTWTEDNNGCTDSDDVTVAFNALPAVSFTGLDADYCVDVTTPVVLTGTPSGGTFTGLGVSGNSFVPSVAGVGTIFITYEYTDQNGCTDSETQTVDVNGLPTVSFTGLDPMYCEDDAAAYALAGSPSGGSFSGAGISGGDFTPQAATSGTHVITYSYTDPFGCSSFEEQTVEVNELPDVSFTGLSAEYCEDAANAPLVGTPAGGTFAGPGIVGSEFSPVAAGVGTHTIAYSYTDGNGCSDTYTEQVIVNEIPIPVISPAGTTEICDGDDITLDAGTGYAIYDWSTNENGQSISVSAADDYSVTVTTFAGCVGTSADVTIVVNPLPAVDLGPDSVICTGSVLELDAGNPGASYSWSTFEITQTINVTTTGSYEVVVTDQNNCSSSDEMVLTVSDLLDPVIVADGPVIFCDGDSVTLDAGIPGSDYLWSTGESTQSITVSTPGLYDVVVTDQYGCSGTDDEVVSTLQLPNAVIQPTGPIAVCNGDTVTLSASNTFADYEWNPGGFATNAIDVWQAGSYTVTVTDPNNGCIATSDPVVVTVNTTAPPTIVASGDTEFCVGESVSLTVEPGPYESYLWTSGSTTPSIVVIETGYYGVTVEDANGCIDSTLVGNPTYVEVWEPEPLAIQDGDTVSVTNGPFDQYQWYLNGQPVPGATSATYVPAASGNYRVEVWDENGCSGTSNNIEFTWTGIADLGEVYNVEIWPNPTRDVVYIKADFGKQLRVELSLKDVAGRDIMQKEVLSSTSVINRSFNIESLSMGMYVLELRTPEGVVIERVIKN